MRNHLKSLNEVMDTLQFLLVGAFGTRALKINRSDSTFRLPNGSTINFMPMADALDLAKAQGLSYDTVTVDEYGNFSPAQMRYVDNLRANLRGANGCRNGSSFWPTLQALGTRNASIVSFGKSLPGRRLF